MNRSYFAFAMSLGLSLMSVDAARAQVFVTNSEAVNWQPKGFLNLQEMVNDCLLGPSKTRCDLQQAAKAVQPTDATIAASTDEDLFAGASDGNSDLSGDYLTGQNSQDDARTNSDDEAEYEACRAFAIACTRADKIAEAVENPENQQAAPAPEYAVEQEGYDNGYDAGSADASIDSGTAATDTSVDADEYQQAIAAPAPSYSAIEENYYNGYDAEVADASANKKTAAPDNSADDAEYQPAAPAPADSAEEEGYGNGYDAEWGNAPAGSGIVSPEISAEAGSDAEYQEAVPAPGYSVAEDGYNYGYDAESADASSDSGIGSPEKSTDPYEAALIGVGEFAETNDDSYADSSAARVDNNRDRLVMRNVADLLGWWGITLLDASRQLALMAAQDTDSVNR